jgi:Uri superfamily endonuclease
MAGLPREAGVYVLVIEVPAACVVDVGRLGRSTFPAGWYLYVGSALGGLAGRVERHLRAEKRTHWHVDYLLAHAMVREVWYRAGGQPEQAGRAECAVAAALAALPGARRLPTRFGASDCRCAGHLVRLPARPALGDVPPLGRAGWVALGVEPTGR